MAVVIPTELLRICSSYVCVSKYKQTLSEIDYLTFM